MKNDKVNLFYFKAMIQFLNKWFFDRKCDCASFATLLSSMDLSWRRGQRPFDPALWEDWQDSIGEVAEDKKINLFYFKAMIKFLKRWFSEGKCDCDGIETLFLRMELSPQREQKLFDPAVWEGWIDAIEEVFKE